MPGAAVAAILESLVLDASPPQHPLQPAAVGRRARNRYAQLTFLIGFLLADVRTELSGDRPARLGAIIHPQLFARRVNRLNQTGKWPVLTIRKHLSDTDWGK